MPNFFSKLFAALTAVLLFSSCAFHTGHMQSSASLTDANFKVVGHATGRAKATRVLGFGGVATEALVLDAKQNLYQNFPLKEGQVLANTTVDFKRGYYIFWNSTRVTISGEIIEFGNLKPNTKADLDIERLQTVDTSYKNLRVGQEVIVAYKDDFIKSQIIDFDGDRAIVLFVDTEERTRYKNYKSKKLYRLHNDTTLSFLEVNQIVKIPPFPVPDNFNGNGTLRRLATKGQVIGLSEVMALVKVFDNKNQFIAYKEYSYQDIRPQ
jgi:hypothetical protein